LVDALELIHPTVCLWLMALCFFVDTIFLTQSQP
jgi:hypothetical protein